MIGLYNDYYQVQNHFLRNIANAQTSLRSKDPEVIRESLTHLAAYAKNNNFISLIHKKIAEAIGAGDVGLTAFAHQLNRKIGNG